MPKKDVLEEEVPPPVEEEEATPPAEPEEPSAEPPAEEEQEPTTGPEKPTVSITESKEFREAVDKAVGKGVSSIQSQLSLQRQAAETAKAEAEEHKANVAALTEELQDLRKEQDDLVSKQFVDDPEARRAYVDRRGLADTKRELAKKTAEAERKLYAAEKLAWSAGMARKADALVKETGINPKELEECQTEEEMEVKALRFKMTKEPEKKEPKKPGEEEEPPKFDSLKSSGPGGKISAEAQEKMSDKAWFEAHKKGRV